MLVHPVADHRHLFTPVVDSVVEAGIISRQFSHHPVNASENLRNDKGKKKDHKKQDHQDGQNPGENHILFRPFKMQKPSA